MNVYSPIIRHLRSNSYLKYPRTTSVKLTKCCSTAASTEAKPEEIIIPARIPRSPTDILEALASTVGRDPTAPHFKYHDDPYLTPMSNQSKRNFAMAQESGRKAAHWLRQEHSEYFIYTTWDPPMKMKTLHKNAEPFIDAFSPRPKYNENSEVTEADLKLVIKSSLLNDAKTIYDILESKNIPVSDETRQELLELFCYFNEEEPISEDWCEERWYRNVNRGNRRMVMWKENGFVQTLFNKFENKTPEMYCALIQGMCKYYQAEKAYNLLKECTEKNIPLNTGTYNGIISVVGFLKESFDSRWELILSFFHEMNSKGLKPDLETLNVTLESLTMMSSLATKDRALKVYSELVNKCKIEPSLATWCHMLNIFYKERWPKCDILYSIVNLLTDKKLVIRDPKDTSFFVTAMNVCRHQLHDVELAKRVHALLLHESNYNLIGDSYKESTYYRNYFTLNCRHESLDVFMNMYNQLVPHIYCVEPIVMEEVIKAIDANAAVEHYPLIWSHIVMFGHTNRLSILQMILDSMINNLPTEETDKSNLALQAKQKTINDVKTLAEAVALEMGSIREKYGETVKPNSVEESFANIAWDLWNKIEDQRPDSTNKISWTGPMLCNVMQLLVRAGRLESAHTVLQKLQKDTSVIGVPNSPDQIIEFHKLALKEKRPSYVTAAAKYLFDVGFMESSTIAKEALQVFLNKTEEETDIAIAEIIANKASIKLEDNNVQTLLSLAAQIGEPSEHRKYSTDGKKEDPSSSSTSSSSSSSDESGDDNDDESNKQKST